MALPLEMAVSKNGKTLYVAALGSSKIGVYDTAKLENDTFFPDAKRPDRGIRRRARPASCSTSRAASSTC